MAWLNKAQISSKVRPVYILAMRGVRYRLSNNSTLHTHSGANNAYTTTEYCFMAVKAIIILNAVFSQRWRGVTWTVVNQWVLCPWGNAEHWPSFPSYAVKPNWHSVEKRELNTFASFWGESRKSNVHTFVLCNWYSKSLTCFLTESRSSSNERM